VDEVGTITPDLTNWCEGNDTSIGKQFEGSYFSEGNALALPHYFYSDSKFKDWFPNRIEVLSYVAINHPNSIVRTKACIILSRNSNGLNSCLREIEWDIDVLRQLILTDWDDILIVPEFRDHWASDRPSRHHRLYSITPRWCIAILNCFAEHGDDKEKVVANSIAMMNNILGQMSSHDQANYKPTPYKATDTFIHSMFRINRSLTDEVRLVTLTLLDLLGSDYTWHRNRFSHIANVWKMIIEMKLTSMASVLDGISKLSSDMDIED